MRLFITLILYFLCSCQNIAFNENDDNSIYKVSNKFLFNAKFIAPDNTLNRSDSLWLKVSDDFYPQAKQTAIIWKTKKIERKNTVEYKEKTGVIDSKDEFFIHPPRFNDFYILSFAAFPSIKTKVFNDSINYYKSEGSVAMHKSYKDKRINKVTTSQEYLGKTTIDLPIKKDMSVHELYATAKSEAGLIEGHYYFSEKLGFVKLHYFLPDSSKISIELLQAHFKTK